MITINPTEELGDNAKTDDSVRTLSIISSLLVVGLGLIVVFGWLINSVTLIQIHPNFPPMQFNTALCFLLSGIGMLLVSIKQTQFSVYPVFIVFVLGLFTLLEYGVGIPLNIDQLFVSDNYAVATKYPGRMSPTTAFCFMAVACSYFDYVWKQKKTGDLPLIRIIILAPVAMIVFLSIIGYVFDFELSYRWSGSTGMALHTTLGFLVLLVGSFRLLVLTPLFNSSSTSKNSLFNVVALSLALVILTLFFFLNFWTQRLRAELYNELARTDEINLAIDELVLNTEQVELYITSFLLTKDRSELVKYNNSAISLRQKLSSLAVIINSNSRLTSEAVVQVKTEVDKLLGQFNGILALSSNSSQSNIDELLEENEILASKENIKKYLDEILNAQLVLENSNKDDINTLEQYLNIFFNLSFLVLLVSIVLVAKQFSANKLHRIVESREIYLNKVLDNSVNGLYIYNLELGRNTMVNFAYQRITGYTLEALNEVDNFSSLFHPEDVAKVLQHMEELQRSNVQDQLSIEYRFRHKLGHWVWCLSNDTVFSVDDQGKVSEFLGSFIDVTERHLNQERLLQSKSELEYFGKLIEDSLNEIYVFDPNSLRFIEVNKAAIANLGYTLDELRNLTPLDITPDFNLEEITRLLSPLKSGEKSKLIFDSVHQRRNGSFYNCHIELQSGQFKEQPVLIAIVLDISELKKTIAQLEESNILLAKSNSALVKMNADLQDFAYVASHDLQEPLRKLVSFSELLKQDIEDNKTKEIETDLNYIVDSATRMRQLIQDLLELSRTGAQEVHLKEVDLNSVVEDVLYSLSSLISETKAEIKTDQLPRVRGDRRLLTQLIQNLIGNSLKFIATDRTPLIHITCDTSKNPVEFCIEDNGIGIEEQFLDRIFLPFKRLHGRSEYSGSGIGLSICRKAVERHGGRLWVESKIGKGSHFKFILADC